MDAIRLEDMIPQVAELFRTIDRVASQEARKLELLQGNILIHVFDVGTRTIVSRGVQRGAHREALDVELGFTLCCEEWVMLDLLERPEQVDVAGLIEKGYLYLRGDPRLWERFLDLAEKKSMLALRAGNTATPPKKSPPPRRPLARVG